MFSNHFPYTDFHALNPAWVDDERKNRNTADERKNRNTADERKNRNMANITNKKQKKAAEIMGGSLYECIKNSLIQRFCL